MEAADGATYVSVSGGLNTSYFVRSDGKIDYSRGSGSIDGTVDAVEGSPLVATSQQLVVSHGEWHNSESLEAIPRGQTPVPSTGIRRWTGLSGDAVDLGRVPF